MLIPAVVESEPMNQWRCTFEDGVALRITTADFFATPLHFQVMTLSAEWE